MGITLSWGDRDVKWEQMAGSVDMPELEHGVGRSVRACQQVTPEPGREAGEGRCRRLSPEWSDGGGGPASRALGGGSGVGGAGSAGTGGLWFHRRLWSMVGGLLRDAGGKERGLWDAGPRGTEGLLPAGLALGCEQSRGSREGG